MFAINYWNFAKEVKKQQHYFHHVNNVPVLYHCNHSKVSSEVANIYHSATTLKSLVYSYIGPLCDKGHKGDSGGILWYLSVDVSRRFSGVYYVDWFCKHNCLLLFYKACAIRIKTL